MRRVDKGKRKRDAIASLYRDWPPDMVDGFIEWNRAPLLSTLYYAPCPAGFPEWEAGWSYEDYQTKPHMGVTLRRR